MTESTSRIDIKFPGGKRVDAHHGGHVIHTDQSVEHGGQGSAPEPFDLFLASLATCAGLYVLVFCQARGIPTEDVSLSQQQIYEDGKLSRIRLHISLPSAFPDRYVDAVRAAANGCRVKKSLTHPPELEVVATRTELAQPA